MKNFPYYKQINKKDCGPTCLKMISEFYGRSFSRKQMLSAINIAQEGVSMYDICNAAERIGLEAIGMKIKTEDLHDLDLPVILHWNTNHFVVLFKIEGDQYHIADPAVGVLIYTTSDLKPHWLGLDYSNTSGGAILSFSRYINERSPSFNPLPNMCFS